MNDVRLAGISKTAVAIAVAVVATMTAIGWTFRKKPWISSNEVSAVGRLRAHAAAQEDFKSSAKGDADGDRIGEYGFFADLGGAWEEGLERGILKRSGYFTRIFLPGATAPPLREHSTLPARGPDCANNQEVRWIAYAWPESEGWTGRRCFAINQEGMIYQAPNAPPYDGEDGPCSGNEAYADPSGNLDGSIVSSGDPSSDGQVWTPS
ncbi:MAG: hypothetical protein HY720_19780 [Planctomycetes bacterium]|nr:hypothetical protein [Planctomycetota bacterium]